MGGETDGSPPLRGPGHDAPNGGMAQTLIRNAQFSVGLVVNNRTSLLAFHVAYSVTYAASPDKTELCRLLAGSVVSRCDQATMFIGTTFRLFAID